MGYTRTAIGLLTRQYRSVLLKCALINLGIFAYIGTANAETEISAEYLNSVTQFKDRLVWEKVDTAGANTVQIGDEYYKYTYTQPSNYTAALERLTDANITEDAVTEKVFDGFTGEQGGAICNTIDNGTIDIDSDFLHNKAASGTTTNHTANAIYNSGTYSNPAKLGDIKGVFIDNSVTETTVGGAIDGGVINNTYGTMGDITGDFVGNANIGQGQLSGGIILNEYGSSIGDISASFIGNEVNSGPSHPLVGGIINNSESTINEISADFIGNTIQKGGSLDTIRGAIINNEGAGGRIEKVSGNFLYNKVNFGNEGNATVLGGLFFNGQYWPGSATMGDLTGNFEHNEIVGKAYLLYGGLLANYNGGKIGNITGDYLDNRVSLEGGTYAVGLIYFDDEAGNITGNFKNNTLENSYVVYGGIMTFDEGSTINKVDGSTFENNIASSSGQSRGAAIYNEGTITEGIKNSTFKGNSTISSNGSAYGGAIYSPVAITINGSNFINNNTTVNSGTSLGGAVYSGTDITLTNTSFIGNNAIATTSGTAAGGAIFMQGVLKVIADGADGVSTFQGNYTQVGENAKQYQAIRVNSATANLTFEAKNGGTINMYDYVTGSAGYTTTLTGDANSTINLYNDIKNSNVTTDTVNISTADGTLFDYSMLSLNSDAGVKWKIDVDAINQTADTIATDANAATASAGTITLNELNYVDSSTADIVDGFKVQILKTQGTVTAADLQLALSDDLQEEFVISQTENTVTDDVTSETKWSDEFYKTTTTTTVSGQYSLVSTDTLNDSLSVATSTDSSEVKEKLGDALALVVAADVSEKTFAAESATEVYTAEDDLGAVKGRLIVQGIDDGENKSTIDLNGYNSFAVPEGAELSLNSVSVAGASGLNNDGRLETYNTEIEGNIVNNGIFYDEASVFTQINNIGRASFVNSEVMDLFNTGDVMFDSSQIETLSNDSSASVYYSEIREATNNGDVFIFESGVEDLINNGTATIDNSTVGNILNMGSVSLTDTEFTRIDGYDGEVNLQSDIDLSDKQISNNAVYLHGIKATSGADSFGENVDLIVEDGSEVDIATNKVSVRNAVFAEGSQLSLKVNNIKDYGTFSADNFDIADGATLDVTFGQNPLDGEKFGEVTLLSLNDGSDIDNNNFTDNFHNNMYKFVRKSDKSGTYGVYQTKTAEEISREYGGTKTNQGAAAAWVDGDSFAGGTAAAVADKLADLAQNDGAAFNENLTAIAPNDDGMVQAVATDLTDRLLLTVDNHLADSVQEQGLASGDKGKTRGYPDLSGVSTWVKGYYGEAKLQRRADIYGFNMDSRGIIAGADRKLTPSIKVGLGMQYDDSDIEAFRRDVSAKTTIGFAYGEYRPSNWFVSGVAGYGVTDYDEDKHSVGKNIAAHYKAEMYSVQGLTGYKFKYFTPEIGARYYKIKRHGYIDGAMQEVSGENMDLLRTMAGVKAHKTYGMFTPNAYFGVTYDVVSDRDNAVVNLANGASYTVHGKRLPRFGVELGAGVAAQVTDKLEAALGYEAKFRKDYQDHSVVAAAKYNF